MSDKSTIGMWVNLDKWDSLKEIQYLLDQTECTFKWELNTLSRQKMADELFRIINSAKPVTDLSL